ncbi:MAG: CRTAC1 family protein [Planctomycetota bacterium]|nr:MAG: CRTAC1 family protein [Planctomycetota bacterium]
MRERASLALIVALACASCGDDAAPPGDPRADAPAGAAASNSASNAPSSAKSNAASNAADAPAPVREPIDFADVAKARGLDYANRSGGPEKATILEANGAGVALLDLGDDGDYDAVFAQGLATLAQALTGPGADLEVFENDGSARFARASGPGLAGWWTGLASGDLDGDGSADLVAGAYGDLVALVQRDGKLVRRDGDGLMPDPALAPHARLAIGAPREAGHAPWWTSSIALADLDLDGALDVYAGQYLELDPVAPAVGELGDGSLAVKCEWKELAVFCGPLGMVPQPDRVLRGRGDATFEDVSSARLPGHVPGYTLAVGAWDLDLDGDPDVAAICDSSPNLLLVNDGRGVLVDRARELGVAVSTEGAAYAGMGVAFADVDRDGRSDFAVTNFSDQPTQLYAGVRAKSGDGLGPFHCLTWKLGLNAETRRLLSWGVHLSDFDADGWLELFSANGHVYPQADAAGTDTSYGQAPALWRVVPGKKVERQTARVEGSLLGSALGTRGSAVGDLDGDGWLDVVLTSIDGPAQLGIYAGSRANHRLCVRLASRGQELGARVRVIVDGDERALASQLYTSVGYQSSSAPELYFGLGARTRFDGLEVRWPSGATEHIEGGACDRRLWIEEGRGIVKEAPLP